MAAIGCCLLALSPFALVSCDDDDNGTDGGDAGSGAEAGAGGSPSDELVPCLEQPGLPQPPNGQLPCDLLPPGFSR